MALVGWLDVALNCGGKVGRLNALVTTSSGSKYVAAMFTLPVLAWPQVDWRMARDDWSDNIGKMNADGEKNMDGQRETKQNA